MILIHSHGCIAFHGCTIIYLTFLLLVNIWVVSSLFPNDFHNTSNAIVSILVYIFVHTCTNIFAEYLLEGVLLVQKYVYFKFR